MRQWAEGRERVGSEWRDRQPDVEDKIDTYLRAGAAHDADLALVGVRVVTNEPDDRLLPRDPPP